MTSSFLLIDMDNLKEGQMVQVVDTTPYLQNFVTRGQLCLVTGAELVIETNPSHAVDSSYTLYRMLSEKGVPFKVSNGLAKLVFIEFSEAT